MICKKISLKLMSKDVLFPLTWNKDSDSAEVKFKTKHNRGVKFAPNMKIKRISHSKFIEIKNFLLVKHFSFYE